jgi:hypothetical protein
LGVDETFLEAEPLSSKVGGKQPTGKKEKAVGRKANGKKSRGADTDVNADVNAEVNAEAGEEDSEFSRISMFSRDDPRPGKKYQ